MLNRALLLAVGCFLSHGCLVPCLIPSPAARSGVPLIKHGLAPHYEHASGNTDNFAWTEKNNACYFTGSWSRLRNQPAETHLKEIGYRTGTSLS